MTGKKKSPVREIKQIIDASGFGYVNRLLIGTPTTGLVRVEWVAARYGQIIPVNWSMVQVSEFLDGYFPFGYQVADAQNIIVKQAIVSDFEWLLFIEHDNIIPSDAFVRINEYMQEELAPIVSGLYFTRSQPATPLIFRGRGNGVYTDWHTGDKIYCDGVPTGFLLVHMGVLREMWKDSPEYIIKKAGGGVVTRRVFDSPRNISVDPLGNINSMQGTSDLDWSNRVIAGDYIRKAGWTKYLDGLEDQRYPLIVDTNLFCWHIDPDGTVYPTQAEIDKYQKGIE